MCRSSISALVLVIVFAMPAGARSRSTAAIDAANDAKADFSARNGPTTHSPAEGAFVANRSVRVVVAAVGTDGRLMIEDGGGVYMGSIDPRAIPRLTAGDKARFGGRKVLEPSDLMAGQHLKITFRGNSSEILRAKVLKDRSS